VLAAGHLTHGSGHASLRQFGDANYIKSGDWRFGSRDHRLGTICGDMFRVKGE
jgi:hypothetical protein